MLGVNLSGGEYGKVIGARYGYDYFFPNHTEIDYYAAKGMDVIRLPFQWERVQPTLNGALDTAEVARIKEVVTYANSKGIAVVLDPHDYGYRNIGETAYKIGSAEVSNASFANFWGKMAAAFKGSNVLYTIMNEPHSQTAAEWNLSNNAAIKAIRDAGATEKILVPGTGWTGAHSWVSGSNDTEIGIKTVDPLNNYAFDVHQYLDADSSGTSATAVSATIGSERLKAITDWARANDKKLFLGEFGAANNATALAALDDMTNFMDDNADVWIGATYWAGGPGWGDYMFSIEPTNLKTAGVNATDRAQMDILEKYDLKYTGTTLQALPPAPGTTTGTALNDTLTGTAGADTILGLGGNDKLDGGAGADTLKGGAGNDSYYVDNAGDVIVEAANEGTDAVFSSVSYAIGANVQTLTLTGTVAVNATGNELANTLAGNSAANTLSAGAGNDKLNGNGGADILTGGAGADTFYFDTPAEAKGDRITDFAHGSDKVYLKAMDANPTLTGDQAFGFIGTGAFSGVAGQLRYGKGTAETVVSGDMNGNGVADFSVTFTGLHTFSASDFTL